MRWFWQRERKGPSIPEGAVRRRLRYEGDVQAVGFRFTAQGWAQARGLTGWVKNLSDGSVELEVQGTPQQIAGFLDDVTTESARKGAFIHARLAEDTPIDAVPEDGFSIRNLF